MCSQHADKIACDHAGLLLETKYLLRMFDGVVANTWKHHLAVEVVVPYADRFKERNG